MELIFTNLNHCAYFHVIYCVISVFIGSFREHNLFLLFFKQCASVYLSISSVFIKKILEEIKVKTLL